MFSSPARISERAARAVQSVFRSPEKISARLADIGPTALWERLADADQTGRLAEYRPEPELSTAQLTARFVIPGDAAWPTALDALGNARPLGVWVRGSGDLAALSARAIAVTGRRAASEGGTRAAGQLARDLASAGRTVTSALSYGIDTAAQRGAYEGGAPALAVVPCGLDTCHPYHQADLLHGVLARGGVAVSAYRPGTAASSVTLATTAQLVAALSTAVVLVEPAPDVTVPLEASRTARRLHRPVFVLTDAEPHSAPHPDAAAGLLNTGQARAVGTAADVLAALS
ncbi:MAG: protecting protein DprA [Streptosporangiaceae bacterium]|nr:protecting protein DprA [Streptosporangiaceae bacterium]